MPTATNLTKQRWGSGHKIDNGVPKQGCHPERTELEPMIPWWRGAERNHIEWRFNRIEELATFAEGNSGGIGA